MCTRAQAERAFGSRYPDECAAVYREVEEEVNSRCDKLLRYYNVDRHIDYADPDSDDQVTTPWDPQP